MKRALVLLLAVSAVPALAEDRVQAARKSKTGAIAAMFRAAKVAYPPGEIYLRVFKIERELELWAGQRGGALALVRTYRVCAESGTLGPKREEGDQQIPEGFYEVSRFNPTSNFHLALGVSYPNEADRLLGKRGRLGGDIMIHGNCVTIGCIPIEDDGIEEVYLVAADAAANGQAHIPIHIFPRRLDEEVGWKALVERAGSDSPLLPFWRSLQPAYALFEKNHRVPTVRVAHETGEYRVLGL